VQKHHYHQKQKIKIKPMSIAAKATKVCKSIKKPTSIPSKTRKDQKAHEHSNKSQQGVQKHQKTRISNVPSNVDKWSF
jgi:hypothetical protein